MSDEIRFDNLLDDPTTILDPERVVLAGDEIEFLKLDDYFKLQAWQDQNEFGVRLGHPVLAHEVAKMPAQYETNTTYNKRKAEDFKYVGLNTEANEINLKCKFNVRKYEDIPGTNKTYQTFNQTYRVSAAIKLGVENRTFTYHPRSKDIDSGFPGGALGWLVGIFDLMYRTIGFVTDQRDPGNLSDTILTISAGVFTSSRPAERVQSQNKCITEFINQSIIYPSDVRMDDKGVWFVFKYEPSNLQKIIDVIESGSC